jgi:hypothetical protein
MCHMSAGAAVEAKGASDLLRDKQKALEAERQA